MNVSIVLDVRGVRRYPCHQEDVEIDGATGKYHNARNMLPPMRKTAAFSLVEVTLALGVAAICLITLLGLLPAGVKTQQTSIQQTTANQIISQIFSFLRADVRLPPGQVNKVCGNTNCDWSRLHDHWRNRGLPDTLYFTNDANQVGLNGTPPANAVFRATITYRTPPTETTALATVRVSWPAPVDPSAGGVPAGSVTTLLAVNR